MAMNPSLHYKRCQVIKESCLALNTKETWSSSDFDEARILIHLCHEYGLPYDIYHPLESHASLIPPYPRHQVEVHR